MSRPMELVWPAERYLGSYVAALERGWSADNVRGKTAADEELKKIAQDRAGFLAEMAKATQRSRGVLVERFKKPAQYGGADGLRYRIDLR